MNPLAPFPHSDDPLTMALFFLFGAVGAVIAGMCKEGRIAFPRVYRQKETDGYHTYLDPGFLGNTAAGGLLAMFVDGRPWTAVFCGVTAAYFGRDVLRPVVAALVKQYGITFEPPTLPELPAAPKPAARAGK